MAMGRRKKERRQPVVYSGRRTLPRTAAHPFYAGRSARFWRAGSSDSFVEELCARFYALKLGRHVVGRAGKYFRLLLIGYC